MIKCSCITALAFVGSTSFAISSTVTGGTITGPVTGVVGEPVSFDIQYEVDWTLQPRSNPRLYPNNTHLYLSYADVVIEGLKVASLPKLGGSYTLNPDYPELDPYADLPWLSPSLPTGDWSWTYDHIFNEAGVYTVSLDGAGRYWTATVDRENGGLIGGPVVYLSASTQIKIVEDESVSEVPLPASAWLLVAALLGLVGAGRRSKRNC